MRRMLTLVWLLTLPSVFAQAPQALDSDLSKNIEVGQKVTVQLTDGKPIKGRVARVAANELVLTTRNNMETFPSVRIKEVRRRADSLWNGLVIGAAAGALMGLSAKNANDCDPNECGEKYYVAMGAGVGAAVGLGLDAIFQHRQVLYRAPAANTRLRIQLLPKQGLEAKVTWRF